MLKNHTCYLIFVLFLFSTFCCLRRCAILLEVFATFMVFTIRTRFWILLSYSSYLPCQRFAPTTLLQYWDTAQTSADVKCAMCISVVARSPFDILVLRPVPTLDYQSRHWAISPDIGPSVQTLGHQSSQRATVQT